MHKMIIKVCNRTTKTPEQWQLKKLHTSQETTESAAFCSRHPACWRSAL